MKTLPIALCAIALFALTGCAPSAPPPTAEPVETHVSSEPSPTETPAPEPERVEFSSATIAYADLVAVAERGDVPVVLLPASLDAAVILVGAPEEWSTASFLRVFPNGDGSITIKPQAKYDAFADPQDYVGESSGLVTFHGAADIVVEIVGVDP